MKIALCLHGLVGSTNSLSYMRDESDTDGKKVCADLSFKDWKRCILDVNDVDVFFSHLGFRIRRAFSKFI